MIASPIPRAPPVTTAIRPSRFRKSPMAPPLVQRLENTRMTGNYVFKYPIAALPSRWPFGRIEQWDCADSDFDGKLSEDPAEPARGTIERGEREWPTSSSAPFIGTTSIVFRESRAG